MTDSNKIEQLHGVGEQAYPSMGDIYKAYDTLQQLDATEPWAFGDKIRRKDTKQAARAVLDLVSPEIIEQVVARTHEWLADKEEEQNY